MKRVIVGLVAGWAWFLFLACGTNVPTPKPVTVIIGDAAIPLVQAVCSNGYAFCPTSFPAGGEAVCESVISARYALTPATMPTVLMCEAQAGDKATFVACQGVSSCP